MNIVVEGLLNGLVKTLILFYLAKK